MHRSLKIIFLIIVLVGALFLVSKFFYSSLSGEKEVCPPGKCVLFNGDPSDLASKPEDGRTRQDFANKPPSGFPPSFPIDLKPVKIVDSYKETVEGTEIEDAHEQTTYSYITLKSAVSISASFEKYLKDNGYEVTVNQDDSNQLTYNVFGSKTIGDTSKSHVSHTVNISAVTQNQLETFVTVSMIGTNIIKNQ